MPVTLPAVPPYYVDPKLEYRIGQELQLAFDAKLGWLDRSYHIAKVGIDSEKKVGYPQLQANDGSKEHFMISADSAIGAYSFLEIDRPAQISIDDDEITYFFSAIFWCNLELIDAAKDYDFTGELIKNVVDALLIFEAANVEVETRPEQVFDKYSGVTQELKQFLMRRYSGFKISFEITEGYTDNCVGEPVDVCQQNVDRIMNLPESVRQCVIDQIILLT